MSKQQELQEEAAAVAEVVAIVVMVVEANAREYHDGIPKKEETKEITYQTASTVLTFEVNRKLRQNLDNIR